MKLIFALADLDARMMALHKKMNDVYAARPGGCADDHRDMAEMRTERATLTKRINGVVNKRGVGCI
jgi:hypothetical protein